jgi:hypothetical protein
MAQAKANLLVANGPIALVEYLDVPWLKFKTLTPNLPDFRPGQPKWWRNIGVPVDTQLPWATPFQRITWRGDSLDDIRACWSALKTQLDKKDAPMASVRRRKLTKEWEAVFAEWKRNSAKYGDTLSRVETVQMWENKDDAPADVQVACNILEHLPDVHAAMASIKKLARQAAVFCVELDALRNAESWRSIINQYFSIMSLEQFEDRIVVLAAVEMKVQGVTAVAAGTPEGRWDNIEFNCRLIGKRVHKAQAHKRKAILACYGPTLKDNLEKLIEDAADGDIISVSGSHDFLIEQGITPKFHVECDPRPHKADNINLPDPNVQYLLGSMVHPSVTKKLLGHDIALWHVSGEQSIRLKDEIEPDAFFVGGGGNVGLRSIGLLYELGYRDFSIYGMDCSFSDDGALRWAGNHAQKSNPKEQPLCKVKVGEREFTSSHIYLAYATNFFDIVQRLPDAQFRVYGDSLLQAWCQFGASLKHLEAA